MRLRSLIITTLLFSILASCNNKKESDGAETVTAFINVNLVPMMAEVIVENQTVLVAGERITAIGPSDEVTMPENTAVIDGAGAYLMPGLADMHMHTSDAWLTDDWPVSPLNLYLANGVTTIRDFETCGSDDLLVLRLREEIRKGSRDGLTMYTSGVILGGRRGLSTAFGTDDAQKIIHKLKDTGYDFVKLYSYVPEAKFYELVAVAKQQDMYTAGHIPFAVGLDGVLSAGMDEIAHIEELDWELYDFDRNQSLSSEEWFPYLVGVIKRQLAPIDLDFKTFAEQKRETISQIIKKLKLANIPICTNIVVSDIGVQKLFEPKAFLERPELKYYSRSYIDSFLRGKERHQLMFKGAEVFTLFKYEMDKMWLTELKQAGIPLLLATDGGSGLMGIVPGFSIHWELQILVENGFTPYEAIATGTVNAAKVIEKMTGEEHFGTIEVGKRADLILVNGNPLKDVSNIRDLRGVMAAGRWYSRKKLEQMIKDGGSGIE